MKSLNSNVFCLFSLIGIFFFHGEITLLVSSLKFYDSFIEYEIAIANK